MEPALEIRMVWENLAIAIAMWAGTNKGLITRTRLPTGWVPVPSDDGNVADVFNPLELRSDEDLARCINNQVRGAVTFSAMQTHNTLEQVLPNPPLSEVDPDFRAARSAIFVLNNSLGQGMLDPVWHCPPAYRRRFQVNSISFVLDASTLDGKPVFWEDFGGLNKYLELLEFCAGRLEQLLPKTEPPIGANVETAPTRENQLSMALSGDLPVAAFIETRCVVDPEARTIAKDLYADYLSWCRDTEQSALVQRGFGIQLTKLGFTRKRRGRGHHWWLGIELAKGESK